MVRIRIPIDNNVIFVVVIIAIVNVSFLKHLNIFFSSKKRIKG